MLLCALRPWDLSVGDVAQEHVRERPLALALERRTALAGEEALALEPVQDGGRLDRVPAQRTRPEDLAEDGGILENCLLPRREPVESGRDDPLQRLGQRKVLRRAALEVEL